MIILTCVSIIVLVWLLLAYNEWHNNENTYIDQIADIYKDLKNDPEYKNNIYISMEKIFFTLITICIILIYIFAFQIN